MVIPVVMLWGFDGDGKIVIDGMLMGRENIEQNYSYLQLRRRYATQNNYAEFSVELGTDREVIERWLNKGPRDYVIQRLKALDPEVRSVRAEEIVPPPPPKSFAEELAAL